MPRTSLAGAAEVSGYDLGIAARQRLDAELVRRGLVPSRSSAQQLIDAHRVRVNGAFADKASRLVQRGDSVEVVGDGPRFVSRAGEKLARALEVFPITVDGLRALDAGASTGGFTQCLLEHGAVHVVAVDVGHNQLHESLVADQRVTNLEKTNIRHLQADRVGGEVDLVVGDLSFISLRTVLPTLVRLAHDGADMMLLVKPQFEAGRQEASRGRGVIRDPAIWRRVLGEVAEAAVGAGAGLLGAAVSPIRGGDGNVEFLYHLGVGMRANDVDLDALVASVT